MYSLGRKSYTPGRIWNKTALGLLPHASPPATRTSVYLIKGNDSMWASTYWTSSSKCQRSCQLWLGIQSLPLGDRACCVCPGCPNPNLTIGSNVDSISQAFYPNREAETFPLPPPPPWEKQGPGLRLAHFFLKSQIVIILGLQARGLCHNYHLCHESSHNST